MSSGSSVTKTARTSSAIDRPTLTAWTTARLMPGTGITTRSSRCGASATKSRRIASSCRDAWYWRWMNSIIATRIGIRITTRYAPSTNLTLTTTTRTTAVRTAPNALTAARQTQPDSRTRRQWMTIPIWLSVKHTNTPTE